MYSTFLFTKMREVNGNKFVFLFWPDFRQDVGLYKENKDYYVSEGNHIIIKKEEGYDSEWVHVSEDASWLLEVEHLKESKIYALHVTGRTREVVTPLGDEFNNTINCLLKEARIEYSKEKEREIRLYFYDSKKKLLRLIREDSGQYKYHLERFFINGNSIERHFETPTQDCFILGRVNKTIGTKNGGLHDFIEPVNKICLDFEKEEWDIFGEYQNNIQKLQKVLMTLLCFTIKKEYDIAEDIEVKRIISYTKKKVSEVTAEAAVELFISEVNKAFENGDVRALRNHFDILKKNMDCSEESFEVTDVFKILNAVFIKYKNGEIKEVDPKCKY